MACKIDSIRYKKLEFVLLKSVFYEIVAFSMFDPCQKVKECAKAIIYPLMQSKLLVPNEFYEALNALFSLYIPFIQVSINKIFQKNL